MEEQQATVNVIARVRPYLKEELEKEKKKGSKGPWIQMDTNKNVVLVESTLNSSLSQANALTAMNGITQNANIKRWDKYEYDKVYGPKSSQKEVFEDNGKRSVDIVLKGYSALITTYGGVQSGKSYTMTGGKKSVEEGLIPRMLDYMFKELEKQYKAFVKIRYLQDYMGSFEDLLDEQKKKVIIRDCFPHNATIREVSSRKDIMESIDEGEKRRSNEVLKNGKKNSRSHAILIVDVEYLESEDDADMVLGRLWFMDLAGSEYAPERPRTQEVKKRTKEGAYINKSLMVLSGVINAIVNNALLPKNSIRRKFVPYRSTNLTRILKEALTGHFMWTLLLTISPVALGKGKHLTKSTLNFGREARKITLKKLKVNLTVIKTKVLLDQGQRQDAEEIHKGDDDQAGSKEQIEKRLAIYNFSNREVSNEDDITEPMGDPDEVETFYEALTSPKNETKQNKCRRLKSLKSAFGRFKMKKKDEVQKEKTKKLKKLFAREYVQLEAQFGMLPSSIEDIKRLCLLFPPLKSAFTDMGGFDKINSYLVPGSKHFRYSNLSANFIATVCNDAISRATLHSLDVVQNLAKLLNSVTDHDQSNVQQVSLAICQICDGDFINQEACVKYLLEPSLKFWKESKAHETSSYIAQSLQAMASGENAKVQESFISDKEAFEKLISSLYSESQAVRLSVTRLISTLACSSAEFRTTFSKHKDSFDALIAAFIQAQPKKVNDKVIQRKDDKILRYLGGAIFNLSQSKVFWTTFQNFKYKEQLYGYVLVHLASIANYSLNSLVPSLSANSEPEEHLFYRGMSFFGSFRGLACGGGLRSANFRENDQYRLYVAEESIMVFFIKDKTPPSTIRKHHPVFMGFHLVRMRDNDEEENDEDDIRLLDTSRAVYKTPWNISTNEQYEIVTSIPVAAGSYRLIPYQSRRDIESDYALSMYTNSRLNKLEKVVNDGWLRRVVEVKVGGKNHGGMVESSHLWRNNPQFQVVLDDELLNGETEDIFISLSRKPKLDVTEDESPVPLCIRLLDNEHPHYRCLDLASSTAKLGRYNATLAHKMSSERITFSVSVDTDEPIEDDLIVTVYGSCSFELKPMDITNEWYMKTLQSKVKSISKPISVNILTKEKVQGIVIVSWKGSRVFPQFEMSIKDKDGLNGPVELYHIPNTEESMVLSWEFEQGKSCITLIPKESFQYEILNIRVATMSGIDIVDFSKSLDFIDEREFVNRQTFTYTYGDQIGENGMLAPQFIDTKDNQSTTQIVYTAEEEILISRIKKLEAKNLLMKKNEAIQLAKSYESKDYQLLNDLQLNVDRVELHFDKLLSEIAIDMTSTYETMLSKIESELSAARAEIEELKGDQSQKNLRPERPMNKVPSITSIRGAPSFATLPAIPSPNQSPNTIDSSKQFDDNGDIIVGVNKKKSPNKKAEEEKAFREKIRKMKKSSSSTSTNVDISVTDHDDNPEFEKLRSSIRKHQKKDDKCVVM
mmetsp:Transcript_1954/g.2800  ORF Transcript_1954/g.2800 Transcript_1954/m.2800 type:complete len:1472 (-) Transcript_1954:2285-6700(-)|eukprot:CAMPEP_0117422920 /NCGR_PEP_ID=MMETSP0758-20121206/3680_1 /TAXON_ID=63605 /ORGANISM="Percolomonas cosmopolitus, Strain AE-1 (ATCC 50343)" /LENGTH=1471 /DNA_ID=CAMNT_0005205863 /DNA_START=61 /DNA_END=4479 /DNA_ORIENTATION=+